MKCKYCLSEIEDTSKKCLKCGEWQSTLYRIISSFTFKSFIVALLVTISAVVITINEENSKLKSYFEGRMSRKEVEGIILENQNVRTVTNDCDIKAIKVNVKIKNTLESDIDELSLYFRLIRNDTTIYTFSEKIYEDIIAGDSIVSNVEENIKSIENIEFDDIKIKVNNGTIMPDNS